MSECCPTCRHTFDIFHLMRDIARNTRFLHYFSSRVPLLKMPFFIRDVISDKAYCNGGSVRIYGTYDILIRGRALINYVTSVGKLNVLPSYTVAIQLGN